jgi:hypothetical protein
MNWLNSYCLNSKVQIHQISIRTKIMRITVILFLKKYSWKKSSANSIRCQICQTPALQNDFLFFFPSRLCWAKKRGGVWVSIRTLLTVLIHMTACMQGRGVAQTNRPKSEWTRYYDTSWMKLQQFESRMTNIVQIM